jgi:hypothetical protein
LIVAFWDRSILSHGLAQPSGMKKAAETADAECRKRKGRRGAKRLQFTPVGFNKCD